MSDQRDGGISWTEETWNCIRGCRRKNDDCTRCYAEQLAATRLVSSPKYIGLAEMTTAGPRWTGEIRLDEKDLLLPLRWARPRLVFTNAMSDLFYEGLAEAQIDRIVTVMALAAKHTFQVLTKRPERMADYLEGLSQKNRLEPIARELGYSFNFQGVKLLPWPIPNIWWGASMGHRAAVTESMPHVAACRRHAGVLWISAEPLIESSWDYLDFAPWLWKTCPTCEGSMSVPVAGGGAPCPTCIDHQGEVPSRLIDWMVGGAESGHRARPTSIAVARNLRDDSVRAGVAFHWKQNGEFLHHSQMKAAGLDPKPALYERVEMSGPVGSHWRVGKKNAGRLLDGRIWNEFPEKRP